MSDSDEHNEPPSSFVELSGAGSIIEDAGAPSMIQPSGDGTLLPSNTPATSLPSGEVFAGRYIVLRPIAHGGMGSVYMAKDTRSGDVVCLKLIRPELMERPRYQQLFLEEGKLARRLSHENIARVYDVDRFEDRWFISMEFVDGMNLRQWLQNRESTGKPVTLTNMMWVARGLLTALDYLHGNKIVHRDIKPDNILIAKATRTAPKTLKLVDFGLAIGVREKEIRQSMVGKAVGTRDYIAPEQKEGRPVDERADIYSAAAVIYRMLAGISYDGNWEPISGRSDVPEGVQALLRASLSKYGHHRPKSARSLLALLERAIDHRSMVVQGNSESGPTNEGSDASTNDWRRQAMEVPSRDSGRRCPKCGALNRALRKSCAACGIFFAAWEARETAVQEVEARSSASLSTSFADKVSLQVMLDHVVPPFRPPADQRGCLWLGTIFIVLGSYYIVGVTSDMAWLFWLIAGAYVVASVCIHNYMVRRAERYTNVYDQTKAMAVRMLTGKPKNGDSEWALRQLAEQVVRASAPDSKASAWVFVWWSDGE